MRDYLIAPFTFRATPQTPPQTPRQPPGAPPAPVKFNTVRHKELHGSKPADENFTIKYPFESPVQSVDVNDMKTWVWLHSLPAKGLRTELKGLDIDEYQREYWKSVQAAKDEKQPLRTNVNLVQPDISCAPFSVFNLVRYLKDTFVVNPNVEYLIQLLENRSTSKFQFGEKEREFIDDTNEKLDSFFATDANLPTFDMSRVFHESFGLPWLAIAFEDASIVMSKNDKTETISSFNKIPGKRLFPSPSPLRFLSNLITQLSLTPKKESKGSGAAEGDEGDEGKDPGHLILQYRPRSPTDFPTTVRNALVMFEAESEYKGAVVRLEYRSGIGQIIHFISFVKVHEKTLILDPYDVKPCESIEDYVKENGNGNVLSIAWIRKK